MKTRVIVVTAVTVLLFASTASAGRDIVVNGQTLNAEQIATLDTAACTRVPTGRYWLFPNGAWGYEGIPFQAGTVGEQCVHARAPEPTPRHRSLSERGLLYSPFELLR
jgi:hypothetical protein